MRAATAIPVQITLITMEGYAALNHVFMMRKIAPVRFSTWNTTESDFILPLLFSA